MLAYNFQNNDDEFLLATFKILDIYYWGYSYDAHFTLTMLLRFCYDNSTAYQWDDKIKQVQTVAGIKGVLPED
ncbi:hypothetical protein [[Flexibacter] sp. ATCC 35208]|uniref:hypothetical protein n=1 Tax=[Flexibacter] sp. ATCC 35208 TaxID=1936242 RepID=UPI0009C65C74|nr:hypothetical protein [[Flexibacter] sp. ATCC 35208]OMP74893.1 hypothetical protein BW716_32905 [[Flexibacter] sp. ATCC 35208]